MKTNNKTHKNTNNKQRRTIAKTTNENKKTLKNDIIKKRNK